ncbi:MAG: CBS domain-containing protein [Deltaproteobacteria bacterium]|nr:CBS domain-containing protein [Deltaproteobacteria bacterium]MBW2112109.1 CBS domain-containing protein [Deltaproteobacteria bacterium]HDZ91127.1 CBS domain-containing protein [Deltaproteobacteria bacterium]
MAEPEKKRTGKKSPRKVVEEVITTHINADFDALSSMLAARKLYPDAALVFPGSQEKNLHNFFLNSVSYLFNFAKAKQVDLEQIKRLILVDTRQKSRIGKFAGLADKKGVEIHIYDHHPDSSDDVSGQVEVVRKTGSATAILTAILRKNKISVSPEEATIMCTGIHEDTGSFTFASTTSEDYEAAAWLAAQGADHNVISDMLTRELTTEYLWVLNDLTRAAVTRIINGVEVVITKVVTDEYMPDFAVLVHRLMDMESLNVVFALAQMADRIYLIARSRVDEVNAAEVAQAFGGGGHPQAASATIKNQTLIQVERSLNAILDKQIRPVRKARDMMSAPIIEISSADSIKEAANLMTRYNINVLLVVDDGVLRGYITRQIVEKAIFLGLAHLKVKEYMHIEFSTVHPDTPLREVQELIIKGKVRILPVVEDDRPIGVITRTDLLTILVGGPVIPEYLHDTGKKGSGAVRKRSMAGIMKERLPPDLIRTLKDFGDVADTLGYNVYLVGGLVRDIFLKHRNLDVDIVVEGDGIRFAQEFARRHQARVRSHRKFGTAVLIFPDGFKVDVATARIEYYESPGAPPIVETSSLKLDLYRRDFTINTLAIKLNRKHYGTLIDYFGAQKDIKEKVLRVLHNLSFVEDPTRMLRAVRFEQRFGFKIGKLTLSLLKNAAKMNWVETLAPHRIFLELKLILKEQDPTGIIKRMESLKLLKFISPDIRLTHSIRDLLEEINKVIAWYNLLYLDGPFEPWKLYWYGLTSELDHGTFKRLTKDMGAGSKMAYQRKEGERLMGRLFRFNGTNYDLYTLLLPYDTETLLYLMAKAGTEKMKRLISFFFTKLKGERVLIDGKELLRMGLQSGPVFRDVFDFLLEARLNNRTKTRDDEIRLVKERFGDLLKPGDQGKPA